MISGEKLSTNNTVTKEYLEEFAYLISSKNYSPQQLYNANMNGLNVKTFSTISLSSKEESSVTGFKMNEQHLTVLEFSNATATNK